MLEDIGRTPEDRLKTEIILNAGVIVFALVTLADLATRPGIGGPFAMGLAAGLAGILHLQWFGKRLRNTVPVVVGG